MHDILTGSDPTACISTAGGDTTCGNWTKSGEGSAIVGHHDRARSEENHPAHAVLELLARLARLQSGQLKSSGGAGLIYCFAAD